MQRKIARHIIQTLTVLQLFILLLLGFFHWGPQGVEELWRQAAPRQWIALLQNLEVKPERAVYLLQEASGMPIRADYQPAVSWGRFLSERLLVGEVQVLAYAADLGEERLAIETLEADQSEAADAVASYPTPVEETPAEDKAEAEPPPIAAPPPDQPDKRIVLYCTHSGETYAPDSGTARLERQRGLINTVAETFAEALADQGAAAEFIDTIHDEDYNASYTRSRQTVNAVMERGEPAALFDIHRDSIPGETKGETILIDGEATARVLIVVGTDERKAHPRWRENMDFAERIYRQAQALYPGLIKGVRTKAGTYNQEFLNHALLLEFGTDQNSAAEAQAAARLMARVALMVLREEAVSASPAEDL
jgi:stage II sporulation protein P